MTILRTAAIAAATAFFAASAILPASQASAGGRKITKLTVGLSTAHHRPVVPTIQVVYSGGRWRLLNKKVHFDLRVYVQVNVGTTIGNVRIVAPAPRPHPSAEWNAWSQIIGTRKLLIRSTRRSYRAYNLGSLGVSAVQACKSQLPSGQGKKWINRHMTVAVKVSTHRIGQLHTKVLVRHRSLRYRIMCTGGSNQPPRAGAKFKLTGGGVTVTKIGRHCPRTVFVKVALFANKSGQVTYSLRSNSGARWTKTISLHTRAGNRYTGSYAHRMTVNRSVNRTFWVTVNGQKIGRPGFLRVVCLRKGAPKGFTN